MTGEGESAVLLSVVITTLTLSTIMLTGCIWEKVVFGQYLFAPAFWGRCFQHAGSGLAYSLSLCLVDRSHLTYAATLAGNGSLRH